mmetsp:Transcript_32460/g.95052  ORF Transcript_32460/g.95052 Transcript_32460/m.95052 type:complete len:278 (+) Transcript_32460:73-906(+)
MVKKLRVVESREAAEAGAPKEDKPKKPRKRAKRPGAPRTAKMKREKRKAAREAQETDEAAVNEQEEEAPAAAPDVGGEPKRKKRKKAGAAADPPEAPPEESGDEKYMDFRVHVRGLPASTTEKTLRKLFRKCGEIKSVRLLTNSRGFRGSAFVIFREADGLSAALQLDGIERKGQAIAVSKAAAPPPPAANLQILAGGLPFKINQDVVRRDFGECGKIAKLHMVRDKQTGKFTGAVFIKYKTQEAVDAALKFDGTEYGGRTLKVRLAEPRDAKREGR